jgi:ribosomal protein S14
MQGRLYRNIKNRIFFKKNENIKKLYKFLIHNQELKLTTLVNKTINKQQNLLPKITSQCFIRNLCFLTTKARSTYRDFRLNRNMIKLLSSKKLLQGIKRSS